MSEVTETSILKAGLPAPLLLLSQLVTARPRHRTLGSSARLSGLLRSDFVLWPMADPFLICTVDGRSRGLSRRRRAALAGILVGPPALT